MRLTCPTPRATRPGRMFTLVELLVVISIIVILISLLLPTLGKIQKTGASIACSNTLKQIGTMMSCYHSDYNEYYPWDIFSTTGGASGGKLYSWVAYLSVYTGKFSDADEAAYWYPIQSNSNFSENKRKFTSFKCPGAAWLFLDSVADGGLNANQCFATNYTVNFSLMGMNYSSNAAPPLRVTQITKPSSTSPCWDGMRLCEGYNAYHIKQVSAGGNPVVDYRHNNNANVLFSDGHTAGFPRAPILPISYRDNPLCLWE